MEYYVNGFRNWQKKYNIVDRSIENTIIINDIFGLDYTAGIAIVNSKKILTNHSWNIDKDGKVVDSTYELSRYPDIQYMSYIDFVGKYNPDKDLKVKLLNELVEMNMNLIKMINNSNYTNAYIRKVYSVPNKKMIKNSFR